MPKLIDYFSGRFDWRYRPGRSIVESRNQSEQKASGDSPSSKPNQRETSEQDESGYKRVGKADKKYKCPTEPFHQTLELIEKLGF